MKALALILAAAPAMASATHLELPEPSRQLAETVSDGDSVFLPLAPFADGAVRGVTAEGAVTMRTWSVGGGAYTTLQLLAPLRDQLEEAGYEILYECEAAACGGFEFRYELEVLPEPEMHVALTDFRYLAARRGGADGPEHASLVVSRSANAGYVQLTLVGGMAPPDAGDAPPAAVPAPPPRFVGEALEAAGHAALDDLAFRTGSAELDDGAFASLAELAGYLAARPDRRVVLVGHTDSVGPLDENVALSRRRAEAVRARLVSGHGVDGSRVSTDGIGYLSPRASNLTPEGRARNRRVEAVLVPAR